MSRYDFYRYYPPSQPIKTTEGIKARSKRGDFAKNWWATRWIETLERLVDRGRLQRGRRYARAGQVVSLEEKKGGIEAKVQGSRRTPYKVTITVDALTEAQWAQVLDLLADQAAYTAQLLAGEMPPDIEEIFTAAGVSLFPENARQLHTDCSCPDWANPCKHVAAVHYILGEQFDEDPFLLFRLRGLSQEQLLTELRARRASEAEVDLDEEVPEEAPLPLPETAAEFWAQPAGPIKTTVKEPQILYPLLKRLGQPAFLDETLATRLGPAYQTITKAAIAAAYHQDSEPEAR